jgi:Group 4 capsule polysaccharide lipoprotein gfcB, YjbF
VTVSTRLTAALVALALVGGCGTDRPEASPLGMAVGAVAKATVLKAKSRKAGTKPAAAPVTRADLEKFGVPILRAKIASRGADAFLTVADTKGDVVTWSTTDSTTFSLRNGVLIQTRGLGPDLMSAEVPSVAQLATNGSSYKRVYFFLGKEDRGSRQTMDCTTAVEGRAVVEIFGRSHTTTHVTETCTRGRGQIKNEFWIEGATIRKSKQFASGLTGYIEFERVVD